MVEGLGCILCLLVSRGKAHAQHQQRLKNGIKSFGSGILAGGQSTIDNFKHEFTWEGTLDRISMVVMPGSYVASTATNAYQAGSNIIEDIPTYGANDYAFAGGFILEKSLEVFVAKRVVTGLAGGPALGSNFGPFRQWIRFDKTFSQQGEFPTYGMKWGASPTRNRKYIREIKSPYWQQVNQKFRNWSIPINSWRTRDAGYLHFWKRK